MRVIYMAPKMVIYRLEDPEGESGMWYDKDGNPKKRIHILCPHGNIKDTPMPYNPELHQKDGKVWYSAGKSKENLRQWFEYKNVLNLVKNGFLLYEMEVSEWQELEMEILYTKKGVVNKKQLKIEDIWEIDN